MKPPKRAKDTRAPSPELVERRAEALRLRKQGYGYERIAGELGVDLRTAWDDVQKSLASIIREPAEDVLRLELERLDLMLEKALDKACALGDEKAIDAVLKIMARRARYLGLDAPEKVATTVAPAAFSVLDLPSRMPPAAVRAVVAALLEHEADEERRAELLKVWNAVDGL